VGRAGASVSDLGDALFGPDADDAGKPAEGRAASAPPPPPAPEGADAAAHGARLLAAGAPQAAERAFRHALATEGPSAEAMVGLGAAWRAQGRVGAARNILERAVEQWPDYGPGRNAHGAALYDARLYAAARAEFAAALRLTPTENEAARLEIERNIAFAEAALVQTSAPAAPAQGPRIAPLGGGRWRLETSG